MGFWDFSNDTKEAMKMEKVRDLEGCLRELERDYYRIESELDNLNRGRRSAEMGNNDRLVRDYDYDIRRLESDLRYIENKIDSVKSDIRYYS